MVKSWVASNLGSKNLGQRNILCKIFWVNTKTWLRKKLTFKKIGSKKNFESRFYSRNKNLGQQKMRVKKFGSKKCFGSMQKFGSAKNKNKKLSERTIFRQTKYFGRPSAVYVAKDRVSRTPSRILTVTF